MTNFVDLPIEPLQVNTILISQEKLDIDIKHFIDNDIIIIQSGTATGKTRCIAKNIKALKEDNKYKILSIVNLISLSREQNKCFREESGLNFLDYQTDLIDFNDEDGIICINSLYKLKSIKDYNIKDKILYIDEVNDLIKSLTHNDSLNKVLNLTQTFLLKVIKDCKKIILTDATINQNVLNLLKIRKENNKTILIKNGFQKFKDIKAIKYNNENEFIEKLRNQIKNKDYFLFGCDCCSKITEIFTTLSTEFKEQKDAFKIYTSKQLEKVKDADVEFKNKYVFYSPSITTGISFVLKTVQQRQFIYITKNPLITPTSLYQMSCRTRNMQELIYYCDDIKQRKANHKTLKDLESDYKNMILNNERLFSLSSSRTPDDKVSIVDNTFFKMFCFEEFQDQIFHTGFLKHYQNLLIRDGFKLEEKGINEKLKTKEDIKFKEAYKLMKLNSFEKFNQLYYHLETEEDLEYLSKNYFGLIKITDILKIPDENQSKKYEIFLTDDYALKNYFNLINLLKTPDYITQKINHQRKESFNIKVISNTFSKIKLLENFECHYKINRFDLEFKNVEILPEISDLFKSHYNSIFPKRIDKKYDSKYKLKQIYVNIIKNICGDIQIIKSKQIKKNKIKEYEFYVDKETLRDIILLVKFSNPTLTNYNKELIEKLTDIKPDIENKNGIKDEDDIYNNYLFNKLKKII